MDKRIRKTRESVWNIPDDFYWFGQLLSISHSILRLGDEHVQSKNMIGWKRYLAVDMLQTENGEFDDNASIQKLSVFSG